jgi:single-strand DNA-binding protein
MLNRAQLIGRLGRDPEIRYTSDGAPVARLAVATNETWKDNQGVKQERTEWHRVALFGKVAEIAREHLAKGALVYLEGRLQTRKWAGQDGVDRYTTEIVADTLRMLGGAPADRAGSPSAPRARAGDAGLPPAEVDDIPF